MGNVRSLFLDGNLALFFLTTPGEIPLLKNLTRLSLFIHQHIDLSEAIRLLKRCPNLEEFAYRGSIYGGYDVPCCVPSRLKYIECELFESMGLKNVESLEYFLKNASLLERMRVHILWYFEVSERLEMAMEAMKELNKVPRRSRTCEIEVKSREIDPFPVS